MTEFDATDYETFDDLPKKLYRVRVLRVGVVPDVALEAFAERFPDAHAEGRFFYPKADRVYLSRSGALERAELLRFNGVWCEVVECSPVWRLSESVSEKLARLEAENAELRERLEGVA